MYIGIDFGLKRIGLAFGESFAFGGGILENNDEAVHRIAEIAKEKEAQAVVIGMPIRSQGEEGTIALKIRNFAKSLNAVTGLPVYFEAEQFTSVEAEERLSNSGIRAERSSGKVDELAAITILEQFFGRFRDGEVEPDIQQTN
ncbi:MAG: Holliday junction resolvase RuvX [Patescibacteria group bacterium]